VKNESIAASRWLPVDAALWRVVRSQSRNRDGGCVDLLEGEPLRRGVPLDAEVAD